MLLIIATMGVSGLLGGLFAHRRPSSSERFAKRLMDFVLWVMFPPVLFFNLAAYEFTLQTGKALVASGAAWLVLLALAFFAASRLNLTRPQKGALIVCTVMGNTAYLGYAFSATALGVGELDTAIIYDLVLMVPAFVLVAFSIGAAYGTHAETRRDRFKSYFTRNPFIYTVVLALLVPKSFSPEWAREITHWIVYAILPLGFFALGIVVRRESELDDIGFPPPLTRPVAVATVLKLGFLPALLVLINLWVTKIPTAYVLQALMPTGLNNLLLANNYGLDRKLTASIIVWTTLVIAVVGIGIEVF